MFSEFVDTKTWLNNWYFFGYLYISSGLVGLSLGREIWKNSTGADRLWLLFITWQVAISLLQIGPYRVGEPDKFSIAIVGALFLCSWFTYRNRKIGSFSLISKKHILEFAVFFVVLTQLSGIIFLNTQEDDSKSIHQLTEKELEDRVVDSLGKGMQEKMLFETYGKKYKKYMEFFKQYEQKNGQKLKELGEYLLQNGYANDKFILMALGTEQYSTGDLSGAIKYLSSALEGEYCSEMAKPSSLEMIHFENAQIYYMLSVIYREQGFSERAKEEHTKSQALFKKIKQETSSQDLLKRWENMSQMALNHFKSDLQQVPSPNR